jgi:hypothetical protein
VVAYQKEGEVNHCLYKKTRKYIFYLLFVVTRYEICHYICPIKTRGKVYSYCYVNEIMSCKIMRV